MTSKTTTNTTSLPSLFSPYNPLSPRQPKIRSLYLSSGGAGCQLTQALYNKDATEICGLIAADITS